MKYLCLGKTKTRKMKRKKIRLFIIILIFIFLGIIRLLAQDEPETQIIETEVNGLVNLDVKDVDIKDIARIFSRVSGLNVVVSDDVNAKVTFRASNVNWESALNMILRTYNLTSRREGNFLRIVTYERFRQEEDGIPLATKVVFLNFAKAEDIASALDSLRSTRGRIDKDITTNSLIITDNADRIENILKVIKELDKRTPEVMIEAMMVDIKLGIDEQLGINWSIIHKDVSARSFIQQLSVGKTEGVIRYGKTLLPHLDFTASIDMWCQNKKAEVLANPRVLTADGHTANIELKEEIPYTQSQLSTTTAVITTTVSFREAGIKLNVTPHISVGGFVALNIKTEQSFQTSTVGGLPIIDTRKAETDLLVKDGETIVIGGLRKRNTTNTIDSLPLLGKIPLLGNLFRKKVKSVTDTELLIFVTPYIIGEAKLSPQEKKSLEKIEELHKQPEEKTKNLPFGLRPPK